MPPKKPLSSNTIQNMAEELIGLEMDPGQREDVVGLLNALAEDMSAMRATDVGEEEPAVIYQAVER